MEKENQVQRQQSDSMMESLRKHLSTAEAETKKLKMQQELDRLVVTFRARLFESWLALILD